MNLTVCKCTDVEKARMDGNVYMNPISMFSMFSEQVEEVVICGISYFVYPDRKVAPGHIAINAKTRQSHDLPVDTLLRHE